MTHKNLSPTLCRLCVCFELQHVMLNEQRIYGAPALHCKTIE